MAMLHACSAAGTAGMRPGGAALVRMGPQDHKATQQRHVPPSLMGHKSYILSVNEWQPQEGAGGAGGIGGSGGGLWWQGASWVVGRLATLDCATSNDLCSMCPYKPLIPCPTWGGKEEGEEARAGGAAARAAVEEMAAGLGCTTAQGGDEEGLAGFGSAAGAACCCAQRALIAAAESRWSVCRGDGRQQATQAGAAFHPDAWLSPSPAHGSGGHGGDGGFFVVEQP